MTDEAAAFELSPFKLNADPRYFFGARSHEKAMAYLHYGLKKAEGVVLVTGAPGAGKTIIANHLLDLLSIDDVVAAKLPSAGITADTILDYVLAAFELEPEEGGAGRYEALESYLVELERQDRRAVLLVDDAHDMSKSVLGAISALTKMQYEGRSLLQLFLFAEPEIEQRLNKKALAPLKQRLIATARLTRLGVDEASGYIQCRLDAAGLNDGFTFCEAAIVLIHHATEGNPARMNEFCHRTMLIARQMGRKEVSVEIVNLALAGAAGGDVSIDKDASVFDRVRAQRGAISAASRHKDQREDAPAHEPPRRGEATLEEVAKAIASASGPSSFDAHNQAPADEATVSGGDDLAASITAVHAELEAVHQSIGRIREALSSMQRHQGSDREAVSLSLSRAEAILKNIAPAMRSGSLDEA